MMRKKDSTPGDDILVLREAVKYLLNVSQLLVTSAMGPEPLDADTLECIRTRILFWKTATQTGGLVPVPPPLKVM